MPAGMLLAREQQQEVSLWAWSWVNHFYTPVLVLLEYYTAISITELV